MQVLNFYLWGDTDSISEAIVCTCLELRGDNLGWCGLLTLKTNQVQIKREGGPELSLRNTNV